MRNFAWLGICGFESSGMIGPVFYRFLCDCKARYYSKNDLRVQLHFLLFISKSIGSVAVILDALGEIFVVFLR